MGHRRRGEKNDNTEIPVKPSTHKPSQYLFISNAHYSIYFSFPPHFHSSIAESRGRTSLSSPRLASPPPYAAAKGYSRTTSERVAATSPTAMVISAEPPPPPPPDPVADAAAAAATSNARQAAAAFSSFPSLKTWGSHRALRCAHVNRAGDATATATARRSPGKLAAVAGEKALGNLHEVEAGSSDADHVAAAPALPPWKLRTRRRRPTPTVAALSATTSRTPERRPSRACAEALGRARFSVALTREEIEEDVFAVTGARPRRRPRRRPRPVQKQLDVSPPPSPSEVRRPPPSLCPVPGTRM
jgi:hypothetical protein